MVKPEIEDSFSEVEDALSRLRPHELSQDFFDSVEAQLDGVPATNEGENIVAFPHLSISRVASSVALLVGAVGIGVWSYSALNSRSREEVVATKMEKPSLTPAETEPAAHDDFRLVNIERRWNSRTQGAVVRNKDGSFSRDVRYSYMDEYRWKNDDTGTVFVELRPHEEVVSMDIPVY